MADNSAADDVITVFLMDDHRNIVEGLIELASQDDHLRVVGYCFDGREMLEKVRQLEPDVVVLDVSMPGMNGLEACRQVKLSVPRTQVMMLTMHASEGMVLAALRRGASGYLSKESVGEFCDAIHRIHAGEICLGQGIPKALLERLDDAAAEMQRVSLNRPGG